MEEKDEAGVIEILYYLSGLAARYANEGLENDTRKLIEYMKEIGVASALARQEIVVTNTILLFSPVAKEACRQGMENALVNIALALGEVGKAAAGQRMEIPAKTAASCLGEMGNTAAFTKTRKEIIAIIFALGGEIGKSLTNQSLGDVANSTIALLGGETGKVAANQKFEDATLNVELLLQEIGKGAIEKNLKETASTSARLLGDLGKAADRQGGLERALLQAVYSLETIKFDAEDRYLMNASIIAEVALMHFESLDLNKLEEKLNKNFRGKRRFTNND